VTLLIHAWVLLLWSLLSSCSAALIASQDLEIETPARPAVWQGMEGLVYRISWIDEKGTAQEALLAEGERLSIKLARGCNQAILLQPEAPFGWCKPAGFLYPFDLEPNSNLVDTWRRAKGSASFESGYAAAVVLFMERAGYDPWNWPVEKLADPEVFRQKDPWTLPPWTAAERLIQGSFRVSLFPSARTVYILPGEGPWWPESALCPTPQTRTQTDTGASAEAGDGEAFIMLPEGLHTFSNGKELLCVRIVSGAVLSQRSALAP